MKRMLFFLLVFSSVPLTAQHEVFYHVFQRSFFDSDGDGNGDLQGIRTKLDYLQELGVNTILLTPLYASDFYHNYFANDFEKIDPEYGTLDDYSQLIREVHRRRMKIYQDVEMQYVAGRHPWVARTFEKPKGEKQYLYYLDAENKKPWYFFDIPEFALYDGRKQSIITVDLRRDEVKDYTFRVLRYWTDPNRDGKFDDGVDGFRLDHCMDDLDNAGRLTNLFRDFWSPLLDKLRLVNPDLKIVAEQANWSSFGAEYFTKAKVDYVFAFRLKFALSKMDKAEIEKAADSTFGIGTKNHNQVVFLENHDTRRFASEPGMSAEKEKAAAALQLFIGGLPSIYYGQEIGMKGAQQHFGESAGNDIPVREAFDWYASGEGTGMANWYKDSGPWWTQRNQKPGDGISLEEQYRKPGTLWQFYRDLLTVRRKHEALRSGRYRKLENDNAEVISFYRKSRRENCLVVVNLSAEVQVAKMAKSAKKERVRRVFGGGAFNDKGENWEAVVPAYGAMVFRVN
jgi:glycosidase